MSPVVLPESLSRGSLQLRLWRDSDEPELRACITANLDRLSQFMPWAAQEPLLPARRLELFAGWRRQYEAGLDATYGIWLDGAVVGGCGLHQRIGRGGLEIGYWVDAGVARRRVAATTAAVLTLAAFDAEGIDRVEIHHAVENAASEGIPRLLGYTRVGEHLDPPLAEGLSGLAVVWRMTRAELPQHRRLLESQQVRAAMMPAMTRTSRPEAH